MSFTLKNKIRRYRQNIRSCQGGTRVHRQALPDYPPGNTCFQKIVYLQVKNSKAKMP